MNTLDWYIEELGIKYHGRYVDDFYCIHPDKQVLLSAVPKIRAKLAELGLSLNPKKFYFQHYAKGVEFTGAVVKPYRTYCCNRVLTNFIAAVRKLNRARNIDDATHAVCSINSYLGLLRQSNEYGKQCKILLMIEPRVFKWIYIKGHYEVVCVKNQYKRNCITQKRIRDGDY